MATENESDRDFDFLQRLEDSAAKYEITVPKIRSISARKLYDPSQLVDFDDMTEINKSLHQAMVALSQVSDNIGRYDRLLSRAKTVYKRAWSREYIAATDKTDSARKNSADIATESLEDDVIVYTQAKEDLKRIAYDVKTMMQSLQTLSSNLRQQMNIS